ncbi:hypothetical protein Egran_01311 [Elaphomyces granulatus]|uniref:Uncharacterized protein n=1 Tax=Elaphomyces granulatus TaxID=519963 RepID=A0A232M3L1_9EURO|nr:hypothetical protein Egran_01311 [Elaphomyces granulatus]
MARCQDFQGAGPNRATILYTARTAVALLLVGIHENIGGIKPTEITTRYATVFNEILPTLKVHRNAIAHGFSHAFYAQDIDWPAIWNLLEKIVDMERAIKVALKDFRLWGKKIPYYE